MKYLLIRLLSRGSVLSPHGPASISKSSSSDCSPEEPLVAPLAWLSPPIGLAADVGVPTANTTDQNTKSQTKQGIAGAYQGIYVVQLYMHFNLTRYPHKAYKCMSTHESFRTTLHNHRNPKAIRKYVNNIYISQTNTSN